MRSAVTTATINCLLPLASTELTAIPLAESPEAVPHEELVLFKKATSNTFFPEFLDDTVPLKPHPFWLVPEKVPELVMV